MLANQKATHVQSEFSKDENVEVMSRNTRKDIIKNERYRDRIRKERYREHLRVASIG